MMVWMMEDNWILDNRDPLNDDSEGIGEWPIEKNLSFSVYFVQVDLVSGFVRGYIIWVLGKGSR